MNDSSIQKIISTFLLMSFFATSSYSKVATNLQSNLKIGENLHNYELTKGKITRWECHKNQPPTSSSCNSNSLSFSEEFFFEFLERHPDWDTSHLQSLILSITADIDILSKDLMKDPGNKVLLSQLEKKKTYLEQTEQKEKLADFAMYLLKSSIYFDARLDDSENIINDEMVPFRDFIQVVVQGFEYARKEKANFDLIAYNKTLTGFKCNVLCRWDSSSPPAIPNFILDTSNITCTVRGQNKSSVVKLINSKETDQKCKEKCLKRINDSRVYTQKHLPNFSGVYRYRDLWVVSKSHCHKL